MMSFVFQVFNWQGDAVPIILGPPPMLWAYGSNSTHPVGLASGEQRWETLFSCRSNPEKKAMATHHTEGQWTREVSRLPQWVSESLTVWIGMQQAIFFPAMQVTGEGGDSDGGACAGAARPLCHGAST